MESVQTNKNEECSCQKTHGYKKETVAADESELAKFMPHGVKALFLSRNETLKAKLSKLYRLCSLDDILAHSGQGGAYGDAADALADRAELIKNGGKAAKNKIEPLLRDFKKDIKKLVLPEDIRLIVSEGGFNALGKYAAYETNRRGAGVKHLICGGGNLSQFDYVREGGSGGAYGIKKLSGAADAVLDDYEYCDIPSGFAFVINTYLALFDWDVSALLFGGGDGFGGVANNGGGVCGYCFAEAQKIVHRLLDAVRVLPKRSVRLKKEIFSACLTTAGLIETAGAPLLSSGAMQSAAALSLLLRREQRPVIDFYEASFLLSPAVARLYAVFLEELPFSFPPDNSLHAARLTEYLGIAESESVSMPPPYFNIKTIELSDYRLRIYKSELKRHIYDVIRVLDEAYPVYFKLFGDDGFWLKDLLSPPDVSMALALGADVLYGGTLLHYIRGRGLLERYVV